MIEKIIIPPKIEELIKELSEEPKSKDNRYLFCKHPNKITQTGKKQTDFQHRIVWMKHYGEIPIGMVIHHINGDKKDNRIENLICLTKSEHSLIHKKVKIAKKLKF